MSYYYTDFVTHLPVIEDQKVILFFITKESLYFRMKETIENKSYINAMFQPLSFPLIARYNDHGDFILDPEHKIENQFVWNRLEQHLKPEHQVNLPEIIDNNTYKDLFKDDNVRNNTVLSVTDYASYIDVSETLMNQPARQGVFTRELTYVEEYNQRRQEFADFIEEHKALSDYDMDWALIRNSLRAIASPDMKLQTGGQIINPLNLQDQLAIHHMQDPTIHQHLLLWSVFTAYLEIIRTPFAPVAGIGFQTKDADILILQAKQVENQVRRMLADDIRKMFIYDFYLNPEDYKKDNQDCPAFVTYYDKLTNVVGTQIHDLNDIADVNAFMSKCSLEQLEEWINLY